MIDGSITLWFHEAPDVLAIPLGIGRTSLQIDEEFVINGPTAALEALGLAIINALGRGDDRQRRDRLEQDEAQADAEEARMASHHSGRF